MACSKPRHVLIGTLLADGSLNDKERAEIAGCSLRTVGRVRSILKEEMASDETVEERYNEYQRHLRRQIPAKARAERLKELMEQTDQLMVALRVIQYADEVDGFITAKTQRKVAEPAPPGPLLIFPPGSEPILTVTPPHALDRESSASPAIDAEVVEVTEEVDS